MKTRLFEKNDVRELYLHHFTPEFKNNGLSSGYVPIKRMAQNQYFTGEKATFIREYWNKC